MTSLGKECYVGTLHYQNLEPPVIAVGSGLPEVLNTNDTATAGQEIIMSSTGVINTPQINKAGDSLHIVGRVGIGVNPADPLVEDLEVDGNVQIDTSGLGRLVFYDKSAGHQHCEFDGDDDGVNGGQAVIKVKEDGGSVQTAMAIRQDRHIDFDKIEFRDLTPGNPVLIGQNVDLGSLGTESVGLGENAGTNNSGTRQVSIGWSAGRNNGGSRSVCIGDSAGEASAGNFSVNIGVNASNGGSGNNAVVIGNNAGRTQADNNCIILNGSGNNLNSTTAGQLLIDPVRGVETEQNIPKSLFWDTATKEVFVDNPRYDITTITGGPGTVTNLSFPLPTIVYARWVAGGPANWVFILPLISGTTKLGTRVIIKNGATASGQTIEIRGFTSGPITQRIDGSTIPVYLPSSTRTTAGGAGSSIELVVNELTGNWIVVGSYNGTY